MISLLYIFGPLYIIDLGRDITNHPKIITEKFGMRTKVCAMRTCPIIG